MVNFEYGGYSFKYNEFQHKLEVKCDDSELLLDAPNFDLSEMNDIYEQLNKYLSFKYHTDKFDEVLYELRNECLPLEQLEKAEGVYEFLYDNSCYALNELKALLGDDEYDEE